MTIYVQPTTKINWWAIELHMSDSYALSSGVTTLRFEIDGRRKDWQEGDMLLSAIHLNYSTSSLSLHATCCLILCFLSKFQLKSMGFGDGDKFISFGLDFDGIIL